MGSLREFPYFMKRAADRIGADSLATPGVEGYVFDGADGSYQSRSVNQSLRRRINRIE